MEIPTKHKGWRPKQTSRRRPFIERFNLPEWKDKEDRIPSQFVTQLENCADDSARRILLGVTEKY